MRARPLSLLCAGALAATGLALAAPATAAPTAPDAVSPAAVADELLVGYVADASSASRQQARDGVFSSFAQRLVKAASDRSEVELVRLPRGLNRDAAIATLQAHPAVAYAEPNWIYTHQATATDPYYTDGRLYGMYGNATTPANQFGSQAGEAWGKGIIGSDEVYVGVIDEGIQFTHPDLDANVWTNPNDPVDGVDNDGNGYVDDTHGWDFFNDDNSVYDGGQNGNQDDHGTHVSGTIGAEANNGQGVVGVNWNVTLISGKFLGPAGGSTADAVVALDYFEQLKRVGGLNIVATNNSWSGGGRSQALLEAIARNAAQNILFVAAAGNGGYNNDTSASYPASYDTTALAGYDNVIAVAAINSTGALAGFSQFGLRSVDLGAPGVGVWSTTALNGYSNYDGTSMATPHVTGALALVASKYPAFSALKLKTQLLRGTLATPSLAGKTVTGGRLDLSRLR
ncbi:MAG: S8 family serine peptidase [Geodermatophilaceae bacterium]|nr:S8 family serine peptidase [Geodermatophilaceae bacterium]